MPTAFETAATHHAAGRFAEAEAFYRAALAEAPGHIHVLYRLGLLKLQGGAPDEAISWLTQALVGADPAFQGRVHDALGSAHRRAGDQTSALHHYRRAAALQPGSAVAALNLGAALADAADYAGAAQALEHALEQDPALRDARHALALSLNRLGRHSRAEQVCRKGLSAAPDDTALIKALGVAQKEQGRLAEAASSLREVVARRPDEADARYNLGSVLKDQGRTAEAVACFSDLVAREPRHSAARLALCTAHLPPLCRDEAEARASRQAYLRELGTLEAWVEAVGPGPLAQAVGASQPFYLPYQGETEVVDAQRLYGRLVHRAMSAGRPPAPFPPRPRPGERIRVGVVSGYFRDHSIWAVPVRGWVEGLDRNRFELIGYHTSGVQDGTTAVVAPAFDRFVQGPMDTDGWRARIGADRPHVLIYPEIGMDPAALRLAAQRLAPVQCNSWGHPVTSGLPTLDYFLSADAMEPPGAEASYTEILVRLPGLSSPVRVGAPAPAPVAERAGLGIRKDACVYWCAQSLYKYRPRHDEVFARIAAGVGAEGGDCQFVFTAFPGSDELTRRFMERLARAFAGQGLDAGRACLMLPRLSPADFGAAMGAADVVLDSLEWSGCNSLLAALARGLPVVTCEGATLRAGHGSAILKTLGLCDGVGADVDAYVGIAVRMGRSPDHRRETAARVTRAPLSVLADPLPVRALEAFLVEALEKASNASPQHGVRR